MLLRLVCRGDASVISRISRGALSWDFHVDVYPWGTSTSGCPESPWRTT
jgi:hypothetical protein